MTFCVLKYQSLPKINTIKSHKNEITNFGFNNFLYKNLLERRKNRNSILKKVKQTSNSLCRPPHFKQEIR